ncbi:MFS general substrate transporter [Apiospora arundinis]|uniref:MFS general substrate transporter n=1 Tax=Apiospora arundinis TaxID=335852 RepID=A0ABR2HPZ2_9PEZI
MSARNLESGAMSPATHGPHIMAKKEETEDAVAENATEPPYSIFTHGEKVWISSLASFGAMFSTLSSYIYFPALVPMADDFGVSLTLINLTVTSYLVVAGIAPAFMGDLADQGGRRLAYIVMFLLFFASNIGIALQKSYAGLLVLRMVQSAGSSGTYGASYGVLADITTVSERGSYVGSLLIFTNAAPSFGPVIAGVLTQKLGWRWIFWFLAILTGAYLLVIALFLPETQRKIVGNGSIHASGIRRSLFSLVVRGRTRKPESNSPRKRHYRIPNPFTCIKLLCDKANFSIICIGSITYTVKMALQTSLAAQCVDIYRLDYLQAGLVYIPSGVGGALGSYVTGKILNRNVQRFALRYGLGNGHYQKGNDISGFPIEMARFQGFYTMVIISALGTAGYGVNLLEKTHLSVPLIMQFLTGATTSSIFTMCGTLLTDLNPAASATVQASYNLVRCIGAGVGIAIQQPLDDAVGPGWCFGIYAVVLLLEIPVSYVLLKHGQGWRQPVS